MRLGLLGDIHGNAAALRAVLDAARAAGVEALCLTGDFVGYYYEPDVVLSLLSEWTCHAVRGNHEDFLMQAQHSSAVRSAYKEKYGSGLEVAQARLAAGQIDYLTALPRMLNLTFGDCSVLLAHGAPWDTDTYVYPDAPEVLMTRVAESGADVIVLGHTHHQFHKVISGSLIVNPGSVGQQRDRKPGAAWTILDTQARTVDHRREHYDIEALMHSVQQNDPALPYNRTVLSRT